MEHTELAAARAATERPADFDSFWSATEAELARIDPEVTTEVSTLRSTAEVETREVRFRSLAGVRVFGWLARRRGGDSLRPGLVVYPGYSGSPGVPRAWAQAGFTVLQISPRGHHLSDDTFAPGFPGLMTSGIDTPATYAYRGLYSDAWRAVDILMGEPDVDRERIGVTGGSQGGALSLIAAACRPVRACAADVPFLTGIRDGLRLGSSYPYEEVKDYLRLQPGRETAVLRTLDYVDTVNFAERITAPTLLSVGLRDDICPPLTAYALYNRLTCPKEIRAYPDGAHEGGGFVHGQLKLAWLARHLQGV